MEVDNMKDKKEKDNVKEDGSNVEGDSMPLSHPTLRLPEFCSRLRDYRSYNY